MKKIKKEALEKLKAEIEERIDNFECLRFDGEQYALTVHPLFEDQRWTSFAMLLRPEDYEEDVIPQPGLYAEEEPVKPKARAVRRSRFVFRQVRERLANHYPFVKGQYDFSTKGFNLHTFRGCITRCFRGYNHVKNPALQQPIWPDYDCNIEQMDETTIRVHIWKKQ